MTLLAVVLLITTVWHSSHGWTFVPSRQGHRLPMELHFTQKPHREAAFGEDVDLAKANDMADHFGKYPLQEVEDMRSALHTDRLKHYADEKAGFRSDLNPDDEIGRLLLEEDLNLQARLLKDINNGRKGQEDMMGTPPFAMDGAMAIQHHQTHLNREHSGDEEKKLALNNQAQAMFALGTGVPEAIMLCLAVAIIMGMPHLVV
jgi:hypothetical protein